MQPLIFLWALVLLNCLHFGAHLYDTLTSIPNWKSGDIQEVSLYRDFHHRAKKANFFAPVIFASILVSAVSLILVYNVPGNIKIMTGISLAINLGVLLSVFTLFRPINEYIEKVQVYDPAILKTMVSKWFVMDKIRLFITLLGLVISIWALNLCYKT